MIEQWHHTVSNCVTNSESTIFDLTHRGTTIMVTHVFHVKLMYVFYEKEIVDIGFILGFILGFEV